MQGKQFQRHAETQNVLHARVSAHRLLIRQ